MRSVMKRTLRNVGVSGLAVIIAATVLSRIAPTSAESARTVPAPAVDLDAGQATSAELVLAGGCFWGVQGVYQHVKGVTNALSGYAGGDKRSADYDSVSNG